ncbi:MAG: response regulator [Arenimonas sp.]|uniref:GGDEF domain-containing response regulator n=1 Tax=Arenimonas sp. TaxID=1872635 RepID=UPI0025C3380F|nr:response regulator [Arenimonas sp.]MBW8368051.1 response regulator [Arenimonas sp.]
MDPESVAKARILVVDDSKLMRKAAHKMLGDEFDVLTADDGELAWTELAADPSIQVVFTDLNMPNLDGYQLLQRIRNSEDTSLASLPVIVVTGADNDEAARMRALDMGATDFITKPFTTVDLLARARAHANNQRITRRLHAQSTVDALTGLGNLAGFLDRLQQDISFARRHQTGLSVMRLEIVDFRRLFLYHGRAVADALVLQVARLLRSRIRKEDTGARVGLGGFALSLPAGDAAGMEGMIGWLREQLVMQPPVDEAGLPIPVVLAAAVMGAQLDGDTTAQSLLAQCEGLLSPPAEVAQATAAPAVPALVPSAEVVAAALPASSEPDTATAPVIAIATQPVAGAAKAPPLQLDPLLDQLAAGDSRAVTEKLPQIIGRLLPVLRLLGPNQRAQLIEFLKRLG